MLQLLFSKMADVSPVVVLLNYVTALLILWSLLLHSALLPPVAGVCTTRTTPKSPLAPSYTNANVLLLELSPDYFTLCVCQTWERLSEWVMEVRSERERERERVQFIPEFPYDAALCRRCKQLVHYWLLPVVVLVWHISTQARCGIRGGEGARKDPPASDGGALMCWCVNRTKCWERTKTGSTLLLQLLLTKGSRLEQAFRGATQHNASDDYVWFASMAG